MVSSRHFLLEYFKIISVACVILPRVFDRSGDERAVFTSPPDFNALAQVQFNLIEAPFRRRLFHAPKLIQISTDPNYQKYAC